MKRLRIITLCSVLLSLFIFFYKKAKEPTTIPAGDGSVIPKAWLVTNPNPVTPKEFIRPADQTFLTFPEWYLVFSPDEQAQYFKNHTATSFPFMKHTAQIWESYGIVKGQIRDNFPYNGGYHLMIWVIGSSASVEYSVKAWYEAVVGRLTDTGTVSTEEDRFNADFTKDYVTFIKDTPWYEFDFQSRLSALWTSTPFFGKHFVRKIERRYILTSELLIKYVYGKLIALGTKTVYEEALLTTEVLVDSIPVGQTGLTIIKEFPDRSVLISLPRYDKFNSAATDLALRGFTFKEIAGNNSAILVTLLVPSAAGSLFEKTQLVFTQPISSNPAMKRVALVVPVRELHKLLITLHDQKVSVEHVFDY